VTEVRIHQVSDDDDARRKLIELLDLLLKTMQAWPVPVQDGSRLAGDRAATYGSLLDLQTMCEHYLGGSDDFLGGLYQLMRPRPDVMLQLPRFALYSLIRAVMESSGQAVWVLGPTERRKRFLRLLQVQMDELKHDRKYIEAHTCPRDDDPPAVQAFIDRMRQREGPKLDARRDGLLAAAADLGISQAEIKKGIPGGYAALIREAIDEQDIDTHWHGRQGAGTWRFISGLSHPSMSRAWSGSIREVGDVGPGRHHPSLVRGEPAHGLRRASLCACIAPAGHPPVDTGQRRTAADRRRRPDAERLRQLTRRRTYSPWSANWTPESNSESRTHHLLKTFWSGWSDELRPDGTIAWTSPAGRTYTTHPGSRLLFPSLCLPTGELPAVPKTHRPAGDRGVMMPRRRRTREQDRAYRINAERALNAAHIAERDQPPPF
jgi:hypothetical protein